jgi:SMI1-KNR4 cell-wall
MRLSTRVAMRCQKTWNHKGNASVWERMRTQMSSQICSLSLVCLSPVSFMNHSMNNISNDLQFTNSGHSITRSQIINNLNMIGITMPDVYLNFLSQHHGGYPSRRWFNSEGKNGSEVLNAVDFFYKFTNGSASIVRIYDVMKNRLPRGIIPIACALNNSKICMSIRALDYGYIYLFPNYHEERYEDNPDLNLNLIAKSLPEFLQMLRLTCEECEAETGAVTKSGK